jgi:hypothetical protein
MKKIIPFFLLAAQNAFAFTIEMKCSNSGDTIQIPLGSSNAYIPDQFYYALMGLFVVLLAALIYKKIYKIRRNATDFALLAVTALFIADFAVSEYYETVQNTKLAGKYEFKNEQVELVMKGKDLVYAKNNQVMENEGSFLYNNDAHLLLLQKNSNLFAVDITNKSCEKLIRVE